GGDQAAKGILTRHRLKPRRDINLGNDAKGHKARQYAQAEQRLNRHGVASRLLWLRFSHERKNHFQQRKTLSANVVSFGPEKRIFQSAPMRSSPSDRHVGRSSRFCPRSTLRPLLGYNPMTTRFSGALPTRSVVLPVQRS